MAMKYGFFNAMQQSDGSYDRTYDAEFFTKLLSSTFYSAVPANAFVVSAGSGLTLGIGSGYGFINGVFFYNDSASTLTCSSASGTRTDLVVARLNVSSRTVSLAISQSTTTAASNEVALAKITVSGSNITKVENLRNAYYGAICTIAYDANKIDGHAVYVQSAQPTSPSAGDLWFW